MQITITAHDRTWTLTDELSMSSYGEPVLSDGHRQYKAGEVVGEFPSAIPEMFGGGDTITVTAEDIVRHGHEVLSADAIATQDGDISGPLTDEALRIQREMRALTRRFLGLPKHPF